MSETLGYRSATQSIFQAHTTGHTPLSPTVGVPVQLRLIGPPPLEATLESYDTVERKNGGLKYRFDLKLTEPVSISLEDMRDHVFTAANGTIEKATAIDGQRRIRGGHEIWISDHWRLRVKQADVAVIAEMRIRLDTKECGEQGALCTRDGLGITGGINFLFLGTPTVLSVTAAAGTGNENNRKIRFPVTLTRASQWFVEVDYETTTEGTATAGTDFNSTDTDFLARQGMLVFEPGTTSLKIPIVLQKDGVAEGEETVIIKLTGARARDPKDEFPAPLPLPITNTDGKATGTISASTEGQGAPPEPLTAAFESLPASHGGNAFTFRLAFSEEFPVDADTVQAALAVTGGSITTVAQSESGKNRNWQITVQPTSQETAVTLSLVPQESCADAGAICTADNRGIANVIGAEVPATLDTAFSTRSTENAVALTAEFLGRPASYDGSPFTFEVRFSEAFPISYLTMRDRAFTVTNGRVTGARRLDNPHDERDGMEPNRRWEITVAPDTGAEEVSIILPGTTDCAASGAICTEDDRPLSTTVAALIVLDEEDEPTVEPAPNATGAPVITGTAQVGETLTAAKGGIADADGLTRADAATTDYAYSYQWIRVDGTSETDITGATSSTYTLAAADEGKKIKVKASFQDDAGTDEARTSAATGTVAAPPPPLTASFAGVPSKHDGSAFTFELRFSETFPISYLTIRDRAFTVTNGRVTGARRLEPGGLERNRRWEITVAPATGVEDVSIALPATTDCAASGAVCTADGRMLSNTARATILGAPGLSVADAKVTEAANATVDFAVTLSRASSSTVTVDYATSDGTATATAGRGLHGNLGDADVCAGRHGEDGGGAGA